MTYEFDMTSLKIEHYELPEDAAWQSIEEVPDDVTSVTTLHALAGAEGDSIDDTKIPTLTLQDIYDIYDDWTTNSQHILVARDDEGSIAGMISYYTQKDQVPFMESVAVHPDAQQSGLGMKLIAEALEEVAMSTDAEYVTAQAQERVAKIYERKLGAVAMCSAGGLTTIHIYIERG